MLIHIQNQEQIKKVQLKFGNQLKHMKIKDGQKNIMIPSPKKKSFGAKVVVTLNSGKKIIEQLDKADAHPFGSRPFERKNYINKFITLTKNIISKKENDRFLKTVQKFKKTKVWSVIQTKHRN